ncbi:MAG: Smr/MutS family protein, partial [Bacteroidia bacterium]|nr:Smr/MutS family protein [Bacteroidia bacterium]
KKSDESDVPSSFAFELARKIGLPENIVKQAEQKAGSGFVDLEKQLRKISRNKRALDEKLARIKNTDKTLESITDKYEKELTDIQKVKKQIIDQAKQEAQQILNEANKKIEATIKTIKEAQAEKEKTKAARRELEEFNELVGKESLSEQDKKIASKMQQLLERKKRKQERRERATQGQQSVEQKGGENKLSGEKRELVVGDKVRFKSNSMVGEVMQIGGNWINVSVGSILSKVSKDSVELISNNEFNSTVKSLPKQMSAHSSSISERKLNFKPDIDIRGERLMDALPIVERFIDDAIMVGVSEVKILHGKGNGILKEEIRKFLKTMPGVVSCKDEDVRFGGSGITIVTLD